jgi:hypothetical protein
VDFYISSVEHSGSVTIVLLFLNELVQLSDGS